MTILFGGKLADLLCVRVRIVREGRGTLEGMSLDLYRIGQVYDLPATVAAYLVTEGFAIVELRTEQHPPANDRRQTER